MHYEKAKVASNATPSEQRITTGSAGEVPQGKRSERVKIFDTTLRDGQQCPGAGMSFERNLDYFRLASKLGVDVIEAGFPSASKVDFDIVHAICIEAAKQMSGPMVAALCQLRREQIETTIEALKPLIPFGRGRLHTYVPVDPELMRASLGDSAENKYKIVEDVFDFVTMAVNAGLEVQFSPEGYSRMSENFDFTTELICAAVDAGATIINCPDTIGGASYLEGEDYFVEKMNKHAQIVRERFPEAEVTWSVHCHNDFGLAVQNTICAVFDGPARQIEGCINGIGERAGNASIEQCIMIIDQFGQTRNRETEFFCKAQTEHIQEISDFVSRNMLPRQPHWPVTGENAARHSSGGHTNAILKNPMAYQPFDPNSVGKSISFAFGPLSGGNHARSIIEDQGFECGNEEKARIAQFIKDKSSERRKGISDDEVLRYYFEYRQPMTIESVDYARRNDRSTVTIYGAFFGEEGRFRREYSGKDSALAALKELIETRFDAFKIISHSSQSDGEGINARSISRVVIECDVHGRVVHFEGIAEDQDIEISAMRALIQSVNSAFVHKHYLKKAAKIDRRPRSVA